LELQRVTLKTSNPQGDMAATVRNEQNNVNFLRLLWKNGLLLPQLTPAFSAWSLGLHLLDMHRNETALGNFMRLLHDLALPNNSVDRL
jgi:hypothetical protein